MWGHVWGHAIDSAGFADLVSLLESLWKQPKRQAGKEPSSNERAVGHFNTLGLCYPTNNQ